MRVSTVYIIYERPQKNFRNNAEWYLLQEQTILPCILFKSSKYAYLDIYMCTGSPFSNKNGQAV